MEIERYREGRFEVMSTGKRERGVGSRSSFLDSKPPAVRVASDSSSAMAAMAMDEMKQIVERNPVVVFSAASSCCLSHAITSLLSSLGVNPTLVDLDHHIHGPAIETTLHAMMGDEQGETTSLLNATAVPAVFVGGKFVGGLERVMTAHICGTLVPQLKAAGALWL